MVDSTRKRAASRSPGALCEDSSLSLLTPIDSDSSSQRISKYPRRAWKGQLTPVTGGYGTGTGAKSTSRFAEKNYGYGRKTDGSMPYAQLSIGTVQYVAEHFFEIGAGKDEVTIGENASNLQSEALWCETARWFLSKFRSAATEDLNMVVAQNFDITECRLAQEVTPVDGGPSPASGVVEEI
ncbi:hypothetical protein B0H16DRAFT_1831941 [Mycena metata]|uniref:Uncharacterized protein n=1 Tax=Mycena metata TaxID=1033252 RepID=A0AAD7GQX6_9AGAR|nr:hypothetical protein B0H16DRAFT_1831941 [Mycena metata]